MMCDTRTAIFWMLLDTCGCTACLTGAVYMCRLGLQAYTVQCNSRYSKQNASFFLMSCLCGPAAYDESSFLGTQLGLAKTPPAAHACKYARSLLGLCPNPLPDTFADILVVTLVSLSAWYLLIARRLCLTWCPLLRNICMFESLILSVTRCRSFLM